MLFTLDSHSHAETSRSRAAAHSWQTDDYWPLTDFFHSVSICLSESGCEGEEESGEGEGDEAAGVDEGADE